MEKGWKSKFSFRTQNMVSPFQVDTACNARSCWGIYAHVMLWAQRHNLPEDHRPYGWQVDWLNGNGHWAFKCKVCEPPPSPCPNKTGIEQVCEGYRKVKKAVKAATKAVGRVFNALLGKKPAAEPEEE